MIKLYQRTLIIEPKPWLRIVLFSAPTHDWGFRTGHGIDGPVRRCWLRIGAFFRAWYVVVGTTRTTWRPLSGDPAEHFFACAALPAGPDEEFDAEWLRLETVE